MPSSRSLPNNNSSKTATTVRCPLSTATSSRGPWEEEMEELPPAAPPASAIPAGRVLRSQTVTAPLTLTLMLYARHRPRVAILLHLLAAQPPRRRRRSARAAAAAWVLVAPTTPPPPTLILLTAPPTREEDLLLLLPHPQIARPPLPPSDRQLQQVCQTIAPPPEVFTRMLPATLTAGPPAEAARQAPPSAGAPSLLQS